MNSPVDVGQAPFPRYPAPTPVASGDAETKYLLPAAAVPPVRAFLAAACRPEDPFASGFVDSIYFDDEGLSAYRDKRASQLHKTKLRLRWYDGRGAVFAEVKRRRGERREKVRVVFEGDGLDGEELSRRGLAAPGLAAVPALLAGRGLPVPGECRPVLRGRFHRRRWVEPASGARVALDTAIATVERADRLGERAAVVAGPAGALPWAVVELKGSAAALPPPLWPLLALGCRRASFSKYASCLGGSA